MTISMQDQITRELARLRIWRHVAGEGEQGQATKDAHERINLLLDKLDSERSKVAIPYA